MFKARSLATLSLLLSGAAITAHAQGKGAPASGTAAPAAPVTSATTSAAAPRSAAPSSSPAPIFQTAYAALSGLELDPTKVATVGGYMLERDVASFMLGEGKLYLCKPIGGRVRAALFVGTGELNFTPPTDVERKQLARFYQAEVLQADAKAIFLYFADSTYEELAADLTFEKGTLPEGGAKIVEEALGYMGESYGFRDELIRPLLNDERSPLFYAHVVRGAADPVMFEVNPYDQEEIQLYRKVSSAREGSLSEPVSEFHKRADYENGYEIPYEGRDPLEVDSYTIHGRITSGMDFAASAEMSLRRVGPGGPWACFYLYNDLKVDSMRWADGAPATFFKGPDNPYLWVRVREGADTSIPALTAWYRGEVLARKVDWVYLKSSIGWYPTIGYKKKSRFDLIFHTPARMKFASVGDNVSTAKEGDELITHWMSKGAMRNASFNIGPFSEREIKPDSLQPITVYMTKTSHSMVEEGISSGSDMDARVGDDVKNAVALFTFLYGPADAGHFYVTEIPYMHGEAFPGLIHLSATTFVRDDESGFDQLFRAHEVAHQWWGIGVDFRTYHDQWLSEAFAEYSGLMYMQAALKQNDKFFKALRNYRDRIVNNRKTLIGNGQESGPIWLGSRTESSKTDGDYDLIVYRKGAWVLHMLRGLLLDNRTMKEDKFREMMRDFYQTYRGGEAGTEDFQKIVEKHVGVDMGWFFDQWVYGTAVPTYAFAYNVTKTPEGKYQVSIRVDQKDVPADFKMYVPVKVDFGDKGSVRDRILVTGPRTELTLPLMPYEPEKVIFNDLESVLCQVEEVSW